MLVKLLKKHKNPAIIKIIETDLKTYKAIKHLVEQNENSTSK